MAKANGAKAQLLNDIKVLLMVKEVPSYLSKLSLMELMKLKDDLQTMNNFILTKLKEYDAKLTTMINMNKQKALRGSVDVLIDNTTKENP